MSVAALPAVESRVATVGDMATEPAGGELWVLVGAERDHRCLKGGGGDVVAVDGLKHGDRVGKGGEVFPCEHVLSIGGFGGFV